jgi:glycerol-3-phosphate dehydrogenase
MERFDVFVIGGGGTGSEIAFQLAERSGLRVAVREREGCLPELAEDS